MARLCVDEGVLELDIAVVGTPRALDRVWVALRERATQTQGEHGLEIPLRDNDDGLATADGPSPQVPDLYHGYALRMVLRRCPQLGPDIPQVGLLGALLGGPREPTTGARLPIDGLLVSLDMDGAGAADSRVLIRILEDAVALLTGSGGPPLPRILLAFSDQRPGRSAPSAVRDSLDEELWDGPAEATIIEADRVDHPLLGRTLRLLAQRAHATWSERPPSPTPLRADALPSSNREEAERLLREVGDLAVEGWDESVPTQKAGASEDGRAWRRLAQILARAGLARESDRMLRRGLRSSEENVWSSLPASSPPPPALQCLRWWSLPQATPRGLVALANDQGALVAFDHALHRLQWSWSAPRMLASLPPDVAALRPVDETRCVFLGKIIQLVHTGTGEVLAHAHFPRARPTDVSLTPREPIARSATRVHVQAERGELLVQSQGDLFIFELASLRAVATLHRGDVLAAIVEPEGSILTIHQNGTLGRWRPGQTIVERIANLSGRLLDACMVTGEHAGALGTGSSSVRFATLVAAGHPGARLELAQLSADRVTTLGSCPTRGGTSVRLSSDGTRLVTLEHRVLRVREVSTRLSDAVPATTLLDPPPWMPVLVDLSPSARFVVALSRTFAGIAPLRLNVWG